MPIKDCPPFSPCFCEAHPNVKQCQVIDLSIDNNIIILLVIGILYVFYKFYNKNFFNKKIFNKFVNYKLLKNQ